MERNDAKRHFQRPLSSALPVLVLEASAVPLAKPDTHNVADTYPYNVYNYRG
jgi:hypothetical protein